MDIEPGVYTFRTKYKNGEELSVHYSLRNVASNRHALEIVQDIQTTLLSFYKDATNFETTYKLKYGGVIGEYLQ